MHCLAAAAIPLPSLKKKDLALWQEMILQNMTVFLSCYTSMCCSTWLCVRPYLFAGPSDPPESGNPPVCYPYVHVDCNGVTVPASCASGVRCAPSACRLTPAKQLKILAVCKHSMAPDAVSSRGFVSKLQALPVCMLISKAHTCTSNQSTANQLVC